MGKADSKVWFRIRKQNQLTPPTSQKMNVDILTWTMLRVPSINFQNSKSLSPNLLSFTERKTSKLCMCKRSKSGEAESSKDRKVIYITIHSSTRGTRDTDRGIPRACILHRKSMHTFLSLNLISSDLTDLTQGGREENRST